MNADPGGVGARRRSFALMKIDIASAEQSEKEVTGLAYTKALYASIVEWYKDVQTRAQLVVTLDGAFVTILGGVILAKSTDLQVVTSSFGWETWLTLGVMGLSFGFSGLFAILALMPLGLDEKRIQELFDRTKGG